ncbi:uncharacterized protein LOC139918611 [Centroberyx gerrardi]|uniref:uncharacterized protein n=1 Tax=Centroberyx gerrardi TaxID=166262 RepID=UPI003AAAF070
MDKATGVTLGLMLLLCYNGNTVSQTPCPARCQCFTPTQVLCSDERMTSLPLNISRQVKGFIVMTTSLSYLFTNTLRESPQLTKLVFFNNVLRDIHAQAFEDLTELQELEISGNPWLEKLFLGTFSKQGNLTKLLLNFNRFKTVLLGMFDSLKELETLQMRGNIISHLPTLLFLNLHSLRVLDLSQNMLAEVERESFSGLAKLEILKMNYNFISSLSSDTFHNVSQLKELSLEGNKISKLPHGIFSALTKLEVLNLRGNLLSSFSAEVFGLVPSGLKELVLKGNQLTALSSRALGSLKSLTHLSLSSNWLSKLPVDIFKNLTALESLDLSDNQLTLLPDKIFYDLGNVKVVHLHRNNLSEVDALLFEDQRFLQQLYLSDNQLQTLPPGFFDPFLFQHIVRLHGNPWKCDCQMWYLHDWVMKNSADIEELDKVFCKGPGFLRGQTVASIDKDQLVCHISKDGMPDLSSCTTETINNTMIIKCKVNKCSPLTVKLQFQEEDGSIYEHTVKKEWAEHLQCSNGTKTMSPTQ